MDDFFQTDLAWLAVEEPQKVRSPKSSRSPAVTGDQPVWMTAQVAYRHSDETLERLRQANLNRASSGSLGRGTGWHHSEETRALMRNKVMSAEARDRIRQALTGRKRGPTSPEVKAKLRQAIQGRKHSEESLARMRARDPWWVQHHLDERARVMSVLVQRQPAPPAQVYTGYMVTPFGTFRTGGEAIRFAQENGLKNARKVIYTLTKTQPEHYYYITISGKTR
jgi:hypothetical protein